MCTTIDLYHKIKGEGQDLICLHGLFGSHDNLSVLTRELSQHYRVHGLDLRNHGASPHHVSMTYLDMAQDVLAHMDAQQIEQAYLLGHSMGGKVAMAVALLAPEKVAKLIVLDIAPVIYQAKRHLDLLTGLAAMDLSSIHKRSDADHQLTPYEANPHIRSFLLKNLYKNDHGQFQWRIHLQALQDNYEAIMSWPQRNWHFDKPTLFIKGGNSDYLVPQYREAVLQQFPQASLKEVANTGHWLHAEKPALLLRMIQQFLSV